MNGPAKLMLFRAGEEGYSIEIHALLFSIFRLDVLRIERLEIDGKCRPNLHFTSSGKYFDDNNQRSFPIPSSFLFE